MSQIAGLQDFRQEGPPADIGAFQFPSSVIVFQHVFSGTTYICAIRGGMRGWVLVDYGIDASTVIQSVLDGLTAGRTWKEKVVLKGGFFLLTRLEIPSYTILEIAGSLSWAGGIGTTPTQSVLYASGKTDIEVIGGTIDASTNGHYGFYFYEVDRLRLSGVTIKGAKEGGANDLRGVRDFIVSDNFFEGNILNLNVFGTVGRESYKGTISGNTFNATYESAISLGCNIANGVRQVSIVGNTFFKSGTLGYNIEVFGKANGISIVGNTLYNDGNTVVIRVKTDTGQIPRDVMISGNVVHGGKSVNVESGSEDTSIVGNEIYGTVYSSIWVYAPTSIKNNKIVRSAQHGIQVESANNSSIVGNHIIDSSTSAANAYSGIFLKASNYTLVSGNQIYDVTYNSKYAIEEYGTSNYNYIFGNNVFVTATSQIYVLGANTKVKYNEGYVTESSGTATIANGTNSINVLHGLAGVPDVIVLGPSHMEVEDARVTDKDTGALGTTFTIAVTNNVTAGRTVDWMAEYKS